MIQFAPDGPEEIGAQDSRDQVIRLTLQYGCNYSSDLNGSKELCTVVKRKDNRMENRRVFAPRSSRHFRLGAKERVSVRVP